MNVYYTSWLAWEHSGIPLQKLGRVPEEREKAVGISHNITHQTLDGTFLELRQVAPFKVNSIRQNHQYYQKRGTWWLWWSRNTVGHDQRRNGRESNISNQKGSNTERTEYSEYVKVRGWEKGKKTWKRCLGFTYWTAPLFQSGNNVLFM